MQHLQPPLTNQTYTFFPSNCWLPRSLQSVSRPAWLGSKCRHLKWISNMDVSESLAHDFFTILEIFFILRWKKSNCSWLSITVECLIIPLLQYHCCLGQHIVNFLVIPQTNTVMCWFFFFKHTSAIHNFYLFQTRSEQWLTRSPPCSLNWDGDCCLRLFWWKISVSANKSNSSSSQREFETAKWFKLFWITIS